MLWFTNLLSNVIHMEETPICSLSVWCGFRDLAFSCDRWVDGRADEADYGSKCFSQHIPQSERHPAIRFSHRQWSDVRVFLWERRSRDHLHLISGQLMHTSVTKSKNSYCYFYYDIVQFSLTTDMSDYLISFLSDESIVLFLLSEKIKHRKLKPSLVQKKLINNTNKKC